MSKVIIQIEATEHLLPGIETLMYEYDKCNKTLRIMSGNTQLKYLIGEAAKQIYTTVLGIDDVTDQDELKIADMIQSAWGYGLHQLRENTRRTEILEKRQICMWYLRNHTTKSNAAIGGLFGQDHNTCRNACIKVEQLMTVDMDFKRLVEELLNVG